MLWAQAAPVVDRDIAPLGDREQRVMGLEILRACEIGLVGGDDRQIQVVGKPEKSGLDRPLLRQPVALQLHIEPVAEDGMERLDPRAGELGIAVGKGQVDDTFRPAGQCNEAFGLGGKIGHRGHHLAALRRREISVGRKPHEIGVALLVLGEKRDAPVGVGPAYIASGRNLALGGESERKGQADDGLDAGFSKGLREFERAEEIVGIGERQHRCAIGTGQRREPGDGERPFEQRIGGVHPQMHEGFSLIRHAYDLLPLTPPHAYTHGFERQKRRPEATYPSYSL